MTIKRQIEDLKILLDEITGRYGEIVVSEQYEAIQFELNQAIERLSEVLDSCENKGILAPFVRLPAKGDP